LSEAAGSTSHRADPEQNAIASEDRRLVWDLIEKVEANTRAVFVAYEIMEMSMEEIAQALGIPRSTGWGRLQQARKELTTALKKHRAREGFALARKRR
jgi:RNA polymerase sigma factor (sigma-70 family)